MMCHYINRFGVCRRMTETLHNEISTKSQTCQRTQFIPRHWSSRILTSYGSHGWLTVLPWHNSIHTTSTPHHLLRKSKPIGIRLWLLWQFENIRDTRITSKSDTSLARNSPSNNERNTPSSSNLIQNNRSLEFKISNHLISSIPAYFSFKRKDINHIPHFQIIDIHLNRQCSRIFHGIIKDGSNFRPNAYSPSLNIGNIRNILPHEPQYRIGRTLP
mmetsp:Transcript_28370/g.42087  ORF Transcript_28370/g.42087 Transcript_28370/m.42087 type:complete len:216 (-) Transcript_28370:316-963(-)